MGMSAPHPVAPRVGLLSAARALSRWLQNAQFYPAGRAVPPGNPALR